MNLFKYNLAQTHATFKALVDAVVPVTPELVKEKKSAMSFGALDSHTDDYLFWSLDHYLSLNIVITDINIHLANATAEMLNIAAKQLINTRRNKSPVHSASLSEQGAFAALAPSDRFRAITLLEKLEVDLASLPMPFHSNPGFVHAIVDGIAMFSIIGYYTEWSGYGSTCTKMPEKRILESFPIGWKQVGYPGNSKGYHALRGYLIKKFSK